MERLGILLICSFLPLPLPSLLIGALNGMLAAIPSYVVILGIYYKLQTFLYLPANGIIQGVRPLIGYNYGRGSGFPYHCRRFCYFRCIHYFKI